MNAPAIAAAATLAYLLITAGAFRLIDAGVPFWLEQLLSAFAAPGAFALLVWVPLLRRLGLSRGEWVTLPSPPAFVLLCALYAGCAYVLVWVLTRALSR